MNNMPSIVIVSSSSTKPRSIIKLITKENPVESPSGLVIQPWKIDTKYYTAIVNIIGVHNTYQRSEEFNRHVEAIIIHMDTNKTTGLEDLKPLECIENDCEPEIKLLVANYCNEETKITKQEVTSWCLKRGYEFVELYPDVQNIQNLEQNIIPEKFGVARIIEALQAHTWSTLVMKNKKKSNPKKSDSPKVVRSEVSPNLLNCSNQINEIPDEMIGEDDFTELFSHLHMMKDSLQSLPMQQRKQCAEEMVTAFWKAIGGDEEELLDV